MCSKKWTIIIPISNDIKEFFKDISLDFFTGAAVTGGIAISDL